MTNLLKLPAFDDEDAVHVVVESPRGSSLKFKYNPDRRVMMLSRPLPQGLAYPHDWGFIPSTRAPDGIRSTRSSCGTASATPAS